MVMLGGGQWVKASNVKDGDVVKFITEGGWEASQFKQPETFKDGTPNPNAGQPQQQFVIDVSIDGNQMRMALNATMREVLVAAFGRDTMEWCKNGNSAVIQLMTVKGKNGLEKRIMLKPTTVKEHIPSSPDKIDWNE